MVSCLPDKRAPGGAPFLAWCLMEEYICGGVKAVAERWWREVWAEMRPGTAERGKASDSSGAGKCPASKPRQQDVAGNRVID